MCGKIGISGGEGGGGDIFCGLILENPEGRGGHMKNPFRGEVWIFSGTTHLLYYSIFNITVEQTKK